MNQIESDIRRHLAALGPVTDTDIFGVLEVLTRREVQFVLIGGLAARLHGSANRYDRRRHLSRRDTDNLGRLAEALREMDAQLRSVDEAVPFTLDVKTLERSTNLTLMTSRGALNVLGAPAGTDGYRELAANAITLEVEGLQLKLASLDDLMRMKEASGGRRIGSSWRCWGPSRTSSRAETANYAWANIDGSIPPAHANVNEDLIRSDRPLWSQDDRNEPG